MRIGRLLPGLSVSRSFGFGASRLFLHSTTKCSTLLGCLAQKGPYIAGFVVFCASADAGRMTLADVSAVRSSSVSSLRSPRSSAMRPPASRTTPAPSRRRNRTVPMGTAPSQPKPVRSSSAVRRSLPALRPASPAIPPHPPMPSRWRVLHEGRHTGRLACGNHLTDAREAHPAGLSR